jgi:hypothetical protein
MGAARRVRLPDGKGHALAVRVPTQRRHADVEAGIHPVQVTPSKPAPAPDTETAEAAAEREQRYRELFGMDEPKPRRTG